MKVNGQNLYSREPPVLVGYGPRAIIETLEKRQIFAPAQPVDLFY
jgi:hypothetical protein